MNRIAVLESFWEYDFVKYYTIRLVDNGQEHELSETDKFYEIHEDENHSHFAEFKMLIKVIDAVGYHWKGAEACFFRFEDAAHALPPYRQDAKRVFKIEIMKDSELRLYCIRVTNEIVILLNGGIKTKDQALDCPNVVSHFKLAQAVAKALDELIREGSIWMDKKEIINNTEDDEIIFYLK